jgi:hypothetical protein
MDGSIQSTTTHAHIIISQPHMDLEVDMVGLVKDAFVVAKQGVDDMMT